MEIKIEPVIRKDKANSKGLVPVCLRLTHKGIRHYHSLKIRIKPEEWVNGQIAKSVPNYNLYNAKIQKEKNKLEAELLNRDIQGENMSLKVASHLLKVDKGKTDFHHYALNTVLPELKKTTKPNTYRLKEIQYEKLKGYALMLSFAEITPQFLTRYHKYLTLEKNNQSNTTIEAFKYIKQVFNHAKSVGIINLYPFNDWKMPAYKDPHKVYLTLDECKEIEKLLDKNVDEKTKTVVAFFLLEAYSGLRFSDWGNFEVEKMVDKMTLKVHTAKTDKRVTLPLDLMPSLNKIINYIRDNNLKFTFTGQHANRILKVVAGICGISKHVTTHVARHSFATQMLSIGISREAVASALGVSMKIVNTYAKITSEKLRNELTRVGGF